MTIDERTRHRLFTRLEQILGAEDATTLMEHLPPVGWADVATKRDLDALAVATKRDLDALATTMRADMYQALHEQMRSLVFVTLSSMIALVGLVFAAVRLG